MARELSCSMACGIFPDQESNPCLLNQQTDSKPADHHWNVNPYIYFIFVFSHVPEEINEKCELPKDTSLSELSYVQMKWN